MDYNKYNIISPDQYYKICKLAIIKNIDALKYVKIKHKLRLKIFFIKFFWC